MDITSNDKIYQCNCGRCFNSVRSLSSHGRFCDKYIKKLKKVSKYLQNGKYVCECGKTFDYYQSFNAHLSHCDIHHQCVGTIRHKRPNELNHTMCWENKTQTDINEIHKKAGRTLSKNIKDGKVIPIWKDKHLPDNMKQNISKGIKKAIREHPESYCQSNINGRCKKVRCGNVVFDSIWEYEVSKLLDSENIRWERPTTGFEYEYDGDNHIYFPDFYLIDLNIYIEVKGYEREKDLAKYKSLSNLIVIKKDIYFKLIKGVVNIKDILQIPHIS